MSRLPILVSNMEMIVLMRSVVDATTRISSAVFLEGRNDRGKVEPNWHAW